MPAGPPSPPRSPPVPPPLLQGPTSSGKTSLVAYLAAQTGHTFVRINNHEQTDLQVRGRGGGGGGGGGAAGVWILGGWAKYSRQGGRVEAGAGLKGAGLPLNLLLVSCLNLVFFSSLSAHPFPVPPPHPQEYLGSYVSDETGRLVFREGLLVQAVRRGHWIVLDELNLAPTEVLEALNRQVFAGQPAPLPRTTAAAFGCAVPGPVPPPPATPAVPAAASGCEERVQGGPRPLPRPKASTIPF